MAMTTLLALAASLSATHLQDPRMDLQIALPVADQGQSAPKVADPAPVYQVQATAPVEVIKVGEQTEVFKGQSVTIDTPVSISFKQASATDVLAWMEKQDVSFIVKDADLSSTKVTLSLKNVPLDEALDALASVLGGNWERRGHIRIFRKGDTFLGGGFGGSMNMSGFKAMSAMPAMPAGGFDKVSPKDAEKFQVEIKQFAKDMANMHGEVAKTYVVSPDAVKIDPKAFADMQKEIVIQQREAVKMQADAQKEMEKAMRDHQIAIVKMRADQADQKDIQKQVKVAMEQAKAAMAAGRSEDLRAAKAFRLNTDVIVRSSDRVGTTSSADVDKFFRSLTVAQKDSQKQLGYVRYRDLSKQQKEWLGLKPSTSPSNWVITLKLNQNEVTIKE